MKKNTFGNIYCEYVSIECILYFEKDRNELQAINPKTAIQLENACL